MRKESLDLLRQLLTTPSPSGYESKNQRIWCDYARKYADEVRTDAYGNAVAVLNPKGDPKVMLDGHVDEIGLMVKHIDDKGFIYFQRIGGVDPALVRGKRVNIHAANGVVRGVIGATAIHLTERGKEPKVPKMHEVFIDIGAKASRPAAGIYACSSVQEETGLNGAKMQTMNVKPDVAVAVDVTHATDSPGIEPKEHGEVKLGKGPTISLGRENHPALTDRLRKVAKRKRIPVQIEAFSQTGGTDAYAIWTLRGGIPSAIVAVPDRYMHSTVEMVDLRDLQAAADLLAAFCADLKKGERFAVKV